MAAKILGQVNTVVNTAVDVYEVPAGKTAVFTVNMCNVNPAPAVVRLSISSTSVTQSVAAGELLEYSTTIPAYGVLERTGLVAEAGKFIIGFASAANVNISAYGYEETA